MTFLNDKGFQWHSVEQREYPCYFKGDSDFFEKIIKNVDQSSYDLSHLSQIFEGLGHFSSGCIETENYVLGWVDHIRSWPIFYTVQENNFYCSQNAYDIQKKISDFEYNEDSLLEFKLSGYVTGKNTLVQQLFCLNAGEFFVWNKRTKQLHKQKYFSYVPTFDRQVSEKEVMQEQNDILDDITLRIIKDAQGKTIWVPLSGGFDSRILLCKLHEHQYSNIQTFTYGPRFNFEGIIAQKIAKRLDVPWRFVVVPKKTLKKYFVDNNRQEFFKFSGNLKAIPCMREYSAIRYLHETNQMNKDSIFLNGQSGDYITGGHLSRFAKNDKNYNKDTFYKVIINKHYDLWKQYKNTANLKIMKDKINTLMQEITMSTIEINNKQDGAVSEETWEYEGRQVCYVVNGQRVYEYFGYGWEMPLWEKSFVDLFQDLPFDMKYDQKIYKKYLRSYNYKGLFPAKEPYIWRWPISMLWVIPLAQIVGIFGRQRKDKFYAFMRYYGHYANQYSFFSAKLHFDTYKKSRNVISLYVAKWLQEHHLKL